LEARPFIEDGKLPVPEPSTVFVVNEVVGAGFTDHTTPRDVTDDPPSEVIVPPPLAVLAVITLMAVVVTVGIPAVPDVVNDTSFPYAVPELFTAYART
jgi:hypothetical protein